MECGRWMDERRDDLKWNLWHLKGGGAIAQFEVFLILSRSTIG